MNMVLCTKRRVAPAGTGGHIHAHMQRSVARSIHGVEAARGGGSRTHDMVVTLEVSHVEMSALKAEALLNVELRTERRMAPAGAVVTSTCTCNGACLAPSTGWKPRAARGRALTEWS